MITSCKAYAKINLYLDVTGIRDNGYHNIKSIMQTVSLHDTITVECDAAEAGVCSIVLTCSNPAVPLGEKNIAYKAAVSFFRKIKAESYNCRIHIEKHIPMEAGLAGGSTDAAAVLRLLNKIHGDPLTVSELCALGTDLGADVPFCIVGGTVLCEGIGEVLTPLPPMPSCHIVIARGGEGVSTPAAYRQIDEKHGGDFTVSNGNFKGIADSLADGNTVGIAHSMYNIFEDVILPYHSTASRLRMVMLECGALNAMMSGSGPSVFGIFESARDAVNAEAAVKEIGSSAAFLCTPIEL